MNKTFQEILDKKIKTSNFDLSKQQLFNNLITQEKSEIIEVKSFNEDDFDIFFKDKKLEECLNSYISPSKKEQILTTIKEESQPNEDIFYRDNILRAQLEKRSNNNKTFK